MLKVQPDPQRGLCISCRESQCIEYEDGSTQTLCFQYGSPGMLIRKPVVKCNEYDRRGALNRHELEKLAWTIRTDRSGKTVGFKAPQRKAGDDD